MSREVPHERVARFLHDHGGVAEVARRGIPILRARWRRTALAVARGYRGDLDEYLNEMDVRQLFEDVRDRLSADGVNVRPPAADRTLRPSLLPARGCLWGPANAAKHGWTADRNWWYFTHPRNAGPALRADLAKWGLLSDDR